MPAKPRKTSEPCKTPAAPIGPTVAAAVTALAVATEPAQQVFQWMMGGATEAQILEAMATAWPNLDVRPVLASVADKLIQSAQTDPMLVRGWCLEATRHLYRKMCEIGDFAGALRAVKLLAELSRV